MGHGGNEQEDGDGGAKAQFIEQFCLGEKGKCFRVEAQEIGEDGVCGVVAEEPHEGALHQMQEAHNEIETLQASIFLLLSFG